MIASVSAIGGILPWSLVVRLGLPVTRQLGPLQDLR
jgi:hypothetical protein